MDVIEYAPCHILLLNRQFMGKVHYHIYHYNAILSLNNDRYTAPCKEGMIFI